MTSSSRNHENLAQPAMHNHITSRLQAEDVFAKYKSLSESNPFIASYRDTMQEREAYFPPSPSSTQYYHEAPGNPLTHRVATNLHRSRSRLAHRRSLSEPKMTVLSALESDASSDDMFHQYINRGDARNNFARDAEKHSQALAAYEALNHNSKFRPAPLALRSAEKSTANDGIARDDYVRDPSSYKVTVRDPETSETIVRSPMKKLFGDNGFLLRSTPNTGKHNLAANQIVNSSYDLGPNMHKLNSIARKVKERVDNFIDAIPNIELLGRRSGLPSVSTFPITLDVYTQAKLYMKLEVLLCDEVNGFLVHEFNSGRVTTESIRKVYEAWQNKGRAQVVAFRYDLITQRELLVLNYETLHFSGDNAFGRAKLQSVLAAWKILAKELSVRTYCNGDSAIKKHMHDAERILGLVNAAPLSMMTFQYLRGQAVSEIHRQAHLQKERESMNGVERVVIPI